jgi:hypothetical protein
MRICGGYKNFFFFFPRVCMYRPAEELNEAHKIKGSNLREE